MTTIQKIIKYCAVAFAIFLIVSILGGILGAASSISHIFAKNEAVGEMKTFEIKEEVKSLEVELSRAQFELKTGDNFSVESNNKNLKVDHSNGILQIKEKKKSIGHYSDRMKVILTIPEDFRFEKANVSTGAGTVKIDSLLSDTLMLDLGAGEVDIEYLSADLSATIDGGAGEVQIDDSKLANLKFDMGIGEADLTGSLSRHCEIDYGIGEMNLNLTDSRDKYCITLNKGLGEAKLDDQKMSDGGVYGNGKNMIEIDGGIGELKIRFE